MQGRRVGLLSWRNYIYMLKYAKQNVAVTFIFSHLLINKNLSTRNNRYSSYPPPPHTSRNENNNNNNPRVLRFKIVKICLLICLHKSWRNRCRLSVIKIFTRVLTIWLLFNQLTRLAKSHNDVHHASHITQHGRASLFCFTFKKYAEYIENLNDTSWTLLLCIMYEQYMDVWFSLLTHLNVFLVWAVFLNTELL